MEGDPHVAEQVMNQVMEQDGLVALEPSEQQWDGRQPDDHNQHRQKAENQRRQ